MSLSNNQLRVQVDTPIWEWCRANPNAVVTSALSASCTPDNSTFNTVNGRYIYYYLTVAGGFWRYDTWSDTYLQLSAPLNPPVTKTSMRFSGSQGYYGRVISATNNTITTGLAFGGSAKGFKIRIWSGKGAGQERYITSVADPVVADYGVATTGSTTSLTDTTKTWISGYVGSVININNWVGYSLRTLLGTGLLQTRKILYNSSTVLTVGDVNRQPEDPWSHTTWVAPAAGTQYQIESSVITVDTDWTVNPDNTSRYVIQSGGIWFLSGAAATPFFTMQYYDALADVWYVKPTLSNMIAAAATDLSLERKTENASVWDNGVALGTHSTTTLQDTTKNWTVNAWAGYYIYLYSGTGLNQISLIASNTATTLTFTAISPAPDNTSRYQIMGFSAGKATSSAAYNTITDSGKSWTVNQWANFAVRIVAGTGAGQLRSISSNTSDTITTYQGWSLQPDNTSIYVIQGDSNYMHFAWGGAAEVYIYRNGDLDQLSHGRVLDMGVACIMCARLTNSDHVIYEQPPLSISTITNSTGSTPAQVADNARAFVTAWRGIAAPR